MNSSDHPNKPAPPFVFRGFHSPSYTIVPDELFDELLVILSGAELKVLLFIIRRTFGWKKDSDDISLSQMLHGITRKDGTALDRGVGLSKPTLLQALRSLQAKNLIVAERQRSTTKGDEPTRYRLKFADTSQGENNKDPVVKKVYQGGGKETLPGPWSKKLTTQETKLQQTVIQDINHRNIRKAMPVNENSEQERPLRGTRGDSGSQEFETIATVLHRTKPLHKRQPEDEARKVILAYITDLAREFNDQASLTASTSRAANLYRQSGLTLSMFVSRLYEARASTNETRSLSMTMSSNSHKPLPVKRSMAYFFACLEDKLGLRKPVTFS